ncbi:MAG: hypothetical protein V4673_19305 [Pseudomonadota bacterium]
MNAISKLKIEKEVARLDGFISGVVTLNGKIRDYTAFSYVIDLKDDDFSIERSLKEHFSWLPSLNFSNVQRLEYGLRDLEVEIRPFLLMERPNLKDGNFVDLRRYLSFRIMEIITAAIDGTKVIDVVMAIADPEPSSTKSVFFCIRMEAVLIVLQFNDDVEFKRSLASP